MRSTPVPIRAVLVGLLLAACGDDTTRPTGPDGVPPVLTWTSPPPGADVSVLPEITIRASEALDTTSARLGVALWSGAHGLRSSVRFPDQATLVVTPSSPLDFGSDYRIEIGSPLTDLSGQPMAAPVVWPFRTVGEPPLAPEPTELRAHVEVLAHDSLRGRGSGTPDEARAAAYIASVFDGAGLARVEGLRIQEFDTVSPRDTTQVRSRNVLGVIPGTGELADEWVVVGAHYDHVGLRAAEDGTLQIHNGADDNASGTAVVLEAARLTADYVAAGGMAGQPRRSILFAAWGAEELGLLGSCYFVRSGVVPVTRVRSVLNFDMVGRLRNNTAEALGWESSDAWPNLLADANRPGIVFDNSTICQSCSDHACFRRSGVPYVWFFTGWHGQYHTPDDDAELLSYDGMARIGEVALRLLVRLVVMADPPRFTP